MFKRVVFLTMLMLFGLLTAAAHDGEPIDDSTGDSAQPEFDIVFAKVAQIGPNLYFQMVVSGEAGAITPEPVGEVAGAEVLSYVWPTSLDSSIVGFETEQGILALVVTSHPDFDDTPLWDENKDGDTTNDGNLWHSHWVVLVADDTCGDGGLKVKDIPEGETPAVPETWPQLPILIDSPDYPVELFRDEVVVTVPQAVVGDVDTFNFDGVTAGLRVNANLHDPFLCVTGVSDIASDDLSLPGMMGR